MIIREAGLYKPGKGGKATSYIRQRRTQRHGSRTIADVRRDTFRRHIANGRSDRRYGEGSSTHARDEWIPPSVDAVASLGNDYMLQNGRRALQWLNDNAGTEAILNAPGAYYTANGYRMLSDRERYNSTGPINPDNYIGSDKALAWIQGPGATWAGTFLVSTPSRGSLAARRTRNMPQWAEERHEAVRVVEGKPGAAEGAKHPRAAYSERTARTSSLIQEDKCFPYPRARPAQGPHALGLALNSLVGLAATASIPALLTCA